MRKLRRGIGFASRLMLTNALALSGGRCGAANLKRIALALIMATAGGSLLTRAAEAHTVVDISTAAPAGLEEQFLAATTAQFLGKVTKNPLASHTYAAVLFGPNPSYNAPGAPPTTLEQALSLGATVYVYGWVEGMEYQQRAHNALVESFEVNCSTPIPTIETWDPATCVAITGAIDAAIFQESLSTPTFIPGN